MLDEIEKEETRMFKSAMFVLSVIIGGFLSPACDRNDRRPPGGGAVAGEGEGEGEGAVGGEGEGEGEGPIAGEGEGAGCVNLQDNPEHCGACGHECEKRFAQDDWISTCVAGVCQCFRNLWRECGASCQQFGDAMRCLDGFCANPDTFIECDAQCSDPMNDNTNCGACGNACGENEQCVEGQCRTCPDAREQWCPKMWDEVACVNVQNDPANCGACGVWCNDFGYQCVNGACVCKPDADHCTFEGADLCTDLKRDWNHCGTCGNQCPRGSECFSSQCGDCVQSWDLEQCNGGCVVCDGMADVILADKVCSLTATDPFNCGRCGNRCGPGQRCEAGRCVNAN